MAEIDKTSVEATPATPSGEAKRPKLDEQPAPLKSPPPKKIDNDQRSQSSSSANGQPGAGSGGGGGKRKRRARKRPRSGRRRYKPYHKLTYEQQQELETKEALRAEKRRASEFQNGRAMAPYNTTQFIMSDLEARGEGAELAGLMEKWARGGSRERTYSGTGSFDSEEPGASFSSGGDESDLDAEFEEQYESVHRERLQSLSKPDLIKAVLDLETDVSRGAVETRELRLMVQRLRADNYTLRKTLRENGLNDAPRPASAPPPHNLVAETSGPAPMDPPQPLAKEPTPSEEPAQT